MVSASPILHVKFSKHDRLLRTNYQIFGANHQQERARIVINCTESILLVDLPLQTHEGGRRTNQENKSRSPKYLLGLYPELGGPLFRGWR